MTFGELFKKLRIEAGQTLRQFAEKNGFDPGNISKLERGILPAPQVDKKLEAYAKALNIDSNDENYNLFFDLAMASHKNFVVKNITDQQLLEKLPVLFRTLDKEELTEEKLDRIIRVIQDETNQ